MEIGKKIIFKNEELSIKQNRVDSFFKSAFLLFYFKKNFLSSLKMSSPGPTPTCAKMSNRKRDRPSYAKL